MAAFRAGYTPKNSPVLVATISPAKIAHNFTGAGIPITIVGDQVIRGLGSTASPWAKVDEALKRAGYALPSTATPDDEAGMIGTRQFERVISAAHKAHAKVLARHLM